MRRILLLLATFCFYFSSNGQPLFLQNPVDVANKTLYGGIRPRVALYQDSIPCVVFGKGGSNPAIYFSKMVRGTFLVPQKLNPSQV